MKCSSCRIRDTDSFKTCERCRRKNAERYLAKKLAGICVRCSTEPCCADNVMCLGCRADHRVETTTSSSVRYWARKNGGWCTKCGDVAPRKGFARCLPCSIARSRENKRLAPATRPSTPEVGI